MWSFSHRVRAEQGPQLWGSFIAHCRARVRHWLAQLLPLWIVKTEAQDGGVGEWLWQPQLLSSLGGVKSVYQLYRRCSHQGPYTCQGGCAQPWASGSIRSQIAIWGENLACRDISPQQP